MYDGITFLSINRYERKKQIDLAIRSLNVLFAMLEEKTENIKLISLTKSTSFAGISFFKKKAPKKGPFYNLF